MHPLQSATTQPPVALSVDEAHRAMQAHLRCETNRCPHRRSALDVLVAAGRYALPDR